MSWGLRRAIQQKRVLMSQRGGAKLKREWCAGTSLETYSCPIILSELVPLRIAMSVLMLCQSNFSPGKGGFLVGLRPDKEAKQSRNCCCVSANFKFVVKRIRSYFAPPITSKTCSIQSRSPENTTPGCTPMFSWASRSLLPPMSVR